MNRVTLTANMREDMSKSHMKELRNSGFIPACVSDKGTSASLEISLQELIEVVKASGGAHALLELEIKNNKDVSGAAIIKNVQKDPVTRRVLHVDFQRVSMTEKITVLVPVEIIGEAAGLKVGGIVDQVLVEVPILALPGDIPSNFEIDSTEWEIGFVYRAGDLPLPEGVEIATEPEDVIATLRLPQVQVEEEVVEETPEAEEDDEAAEEEGEAEGESEN